MGRQNQREKAEQFRDNMRALVRHQGWTQREAAKQLGLDYITLRKYLNVGIANVTETNRPRLERICKMLRVAKIEFLWASGLKLGRLSAISAEAEAESLTFQLLHLLADEYRDTAAVKKICNAIESAFNGLACGIKEPKERARGSSYVDRDTTGAVVRKNRRRGGERKIEDD